MEDNLHPKINEPLRISGAMYYWRNSRRRKICKCIGKYANFINFFALNLVVLPATIGSIKIALFLSEISAPFVLISSFITIFLTLSNGFVSLSNYF